MPSPNKPQVKILSFGDNLQARLSLIAGLHNKSAKQHHHTLVPAKESAYQQRAEGVNTTHFTHQSEERFYQHLCTLTQDLRRDSFDAGLYDGAIWVTEGALATEHSDMLRVLGLCKLALIIFVLTPLEGNNAEQEFIEACKAAGFSGDDLKVIQGDPSAEASVRVLYEAIEEVFRTKPPKPDTFLLPIEDTFSIGNRGVVATGRITRGVVTIRDEVELLGVRPTRLVTITGIEFGFSRGTHYAEAGLNIGVMLKELQDGDIERGQILAQPGTVHLSDTFEAELYFYPYSHIGELLSSPSIEQPLQLVLYTRRVQAMLISAEVGVGALTHATLQTETPIALCPLAKFYLQQSRKVSGIGLVTKIVTRP
jgi:elongation factor Tu